MLLKNLIKNISKNEKKLFISGISTNSEEVKKKIIFFLLLKEIKIMEKNLYLKQFTKEPLS